MKIALFPNPSGSAFWRLIDPAKYLSREPGFEIRLGTEGITEEIAEWADVYVLQSCTYKEGVALLYQYQQEKGKKIVVEVDDYIKPNPENPYAKDHEIMDAHEVITRTIEIADMVTTTTDYLAGKLKELSPNVKVLPNYMDMERWDLAKYKNTSDTIRIGWAGSFTHIKDLELVVNPLKRICDEFPQVRLIFVGDTRIADSFKGYPVDVMWGVDFELWPSKLAGLRLDIGIAPLQDNLFNRCKSNIKWQEYGINQIPGVFSPTVYYKRWFEGKLGMIAYNEDQWYRCLRNLVLHKELRDDIATSAYAMVRSKYDLEKRIHMWVTAYNSLFDSSSS